MSKRWWATSGVLVAVVAAIGISIATVGSGASDSDSDKGKRIVDYSAATGNIYPEAAMPPVTARLVKHGEWVYRGLCIGCHGPKGDGQGAVWTMADKYSPNHKLPRQPRDFEGAVFKIRSTPSGSLPTDLDLFEAISRGLVADQDMPSFKFLPERDRWAVISYIKSLSERWVEEQDYQEPPIKVSRAPIPTRAMLNAGKNVYKEMKCAKCHGPTGKGDGPSAPELQDDNGLSIVPRDFTDSSKFVGSSTPRGIYRTFTTGFDGTPMPSFADFLEEKQRWQLVWYVMSLRPDWNLPQARAELQKKRNASAASFNSDTTGNAS